MQYAASIISIGALLALAGAENPIGSAAVLIFILLSVSFPLVSWRFIGQILAESMLNRMLLRSPFRRSGLEYFFEPPAAYDPEIWWRTAQLLLFVFGTSSLAVSRLTSITPENSVNALAGFYFIGLFILILPALAYVIFWLYMDSGLRCYDPTNGTVSIPGARGVQIITGFGGGGTFVSFTVALAGNVLSALVLVAILVVFLGPLNLLVTTAFYDKWGPKVLEKFERSRAVGQVERGSVRVSVGVAQQQ